MITLYGIKNCDTVKKAQKWLKENEHEYQFHDFRSQGLSEEKVQFWLSKLAWDELLNKRSTSYRQLSEQDKQTLSADTVARYLLDNPTLVKRPLLECGDEVLIGFKATDYQQKIK